MLFGEAKLKPPFFTHAFNSNKSQGSLDSTVKKCSTFVSSKFVVVCVSSHYRAVNIHVEKLHRKLLKIKMVFVYFRFLIYTFEFCYNGHTDM